MKPTTLFLSCALIGLSSHLYAQKTLTFATEATYPPFASMNPQGKMIGFGPDIVHVLCKQMKVKCQLVNNPSFAALIPDLKLGKYDALFGGMGITKKRGKIVDFSAPYYKDTASIVVAKNSPWNQSNIKKKLIGQTIGVQRGTLFQTYLEKHYGSKTVSKMKLYASNMQALLDLQNGRLNAVLIDTPVAALWLKHHKNSGLKVAGKLSDPSTFGKGVGIAVQKGNQALVKKINHALKVIKTNGQWQKIKDHYFGA